METSVAVVSGPKHLPTTTTTTTTTTTEVVLNERNQLCVKRKTLQAVLEQCQRALELIQTTTGTGDDVDNELLEEIYDQGDPEIAELCNLLKSGVESPNFLEKLGSVYVPVPINTLDEDSSWDMVSESDLWEAANTESNQESYMLVRQEDIVEGIACFTAAYLQSLEQTKELTPNQLQEALSKTFSVKKRKRKLRKAWDGSKVIYNVASWGATAIGIYQTQHYLVQLQWLSGLHVA
ncbi:hypothetical protein GIB67_034631 [Kingdonia uniflora]|uniref:Uncharacterized protein n=1 Tax=Kingdonia uniflora TaxID=39325 RepID=A0A7J7P5X8_9MAGN|nr:hypothetical protein GIB67_034631 [Kingdonia uniflora]